MDHQGVVLVCLGCFPRTALLACLVRVDFKISGTQTEIFNRQLKGRGTCRY